MEVFQRVHESHRPQKNLPAAMCFISAPSFLPRERERTTSPRGLRRGVNQKKKGKESRRKETLEHSILGNMRRAKESRVELRRGIKWPPPSPLLRNIRVRLARGHQRGRINQKAEREKEKLSEAEVQRASAFHVVTANNSKYWLS